MIKEIRAFIRILKEIGIYTLYINCRKEYFSNRDILYTRKNIFEFAKDIDTFSRMIDNSLSWCDTICEDLWYRLYDEAYGMKCTEIIKSNTKLKKMKEIIIDELELE